MQIHTWNFWPCHHVEKLYYITGKGTDKSRWGWIQGGEKVHYRVASASFLFDLSPLCLSEHVEQEAYTIFYSTLNLTLFKTYISSHAETLKTFQKNEAMPTGDVFVFLKAKLSVRRIIENLFDKYPILHD